MSDISNGVDLAQVQSPEQRIEALERRIKAYEEDDRSHAVRVRQQIILTHLSLLLDNGLTIPQAIADADLISDFILNGDRSDFPFTDRATGARFRVVMEMNNGSLMRKYEDGIIVPIQ